MPQFRPKKVRSRSKVLSPAVRTEAELESRLAAALVVAFPNIPRKELIEQRRFKVKLGHKTHEFDSAALWEKAGRADILIFQGERPLAVVEIKREDLALTHDDYEQAQSYATQLTPRPPLVIVTNGAETRVYDSNTGQPWSGGDDASAAVADLLENAANRAAGCKRGQPRNSKPSLLLSGDVRPIPKSSLAHVEVDWIGDHHRRLLSDSARQRLRSYFP
jgi:hypothetical protein